MKIDFVSLFCKSLYATHVNFISFLLVEMDFENENDQTEMDTEMIPIISLTNFAEESNYPISSDAHTTEGGFKSVSNARLSSEQQAALEDPNEKDILELLQQMDDFEPIVRLF